MKHKSECKIYHDSVVTWTIPKDSIETILLSQKKNNNNNQKRDGLLYLDIESAGTIEFTDTSCRLNSNKEKICNKITHNINYKNGKKDYVMTPLAVVNFHTHPLSCYINAETLWGWPSGEDLAQCINFANDNSLTHLIFAVEGTYIIDFNKILLNYLKTNISLLKQVTTNIEEIFKKTHKHRMLENYSNKNITLEHEFYEIFLKPLNLPQKENILLSWLNLVNSITLQDLIKLSVQFSNFFNEIKKISISNINSRYLSMNLFNIQFIKNNTIQWNNKLSKQQIFDTFKKQKHNLEIILPEEIHYTAPFISKDCKL